MRPPHQIIIVTGRIDDDDAATASQRIDGIGESLASGGFILGGRMMDFTETKMLGNLEIAANLPGPGAPVLDKMGKALLPGIKIDRGHALTGFDQGNRKVHGDGRFARSAFFVGHNDHLGG
jgi:hypothetical protein